MLELPLPALPIWLQAAEAALERVMAIDAAVGDVWPEDFDPNDATLYGHAIAALRDAIAQGTTRVALSGKPLQFLLALQPRASTPLDC